MIMKSWLVLTIASFLWASSWAQQNSITFLPSTTVPIERCRTDVNIFRCSGFGSLLGITIPPLIPSTNIVGFFPSHSAGRVTTRGTTFRAELLSVTPDGNGNAMFDAIFSFNNTDFEDSMKISVQCTIGAQSGSNLVHTSVIDVLDEPQPIQDGCFVRDMNGSTTVNGRLIWFDSSPRNVLFYRVNETSGQINVTEVRSTSLMVNLTVNTQYSFIIESIGPCGQTTSNVSLSVTESGQVSVITSSSTDALIGVGVAGFGLAGVCIIVIIILAIVLAKRSS